MNNSHLLMNQQYSRIAVNLVILGIVGVIAFVPRLGFVLRVTLLLSSIYIGSTIWFLNTGMVGTGRLYYLLVVVIAALMLKPRNAILIWLFTIATMGVICIGFLHGWIAPSADIAGGVVVPHFLFSYWLSQVNVSGMIGGIVLLTMIMLRRSLYQAHTASQALQELNSVLEQRIAERTQELTSINQQLRCEIEQRQQAEQRTIEQQRAITMLQERERLACELHDTVGQVLGYVNTQTQAITDLLNRNDSAATLPLLDHLMTTVQQSSMDIRDYILGVRVGSTLQSTQATLPTARPFSETISAYLAQFRQLNSIEVHLNRAPDFTRVHLAPTIELHLLRIIQEALTNVRKHAQATQVAIALTHTNDMLQVDITDNGCGFVLPTSTAALASNDHGYGLTSMHRRVADIGGQLQIETAPGKGCHIVVTVPLRRQDDRVYQPIRLLLVDDNPTFRTGLQHFLTGRGFAVVGTASNGDEAQTQARLLQPDIILMDVQMPVCDGIQATRAIKAELPQIQIVMLTVSEDSTHLFDALKYGASGYLLKSLKGDDMCDMLHNLRRGEVPLSPGLAMRILREFAQHQPAPNDAFADTVGPEVNLTEYQMKLLMLLAQGLTQQEIGARVGYTERSIRRHLAEIIDTLHLRNRNEAIVYAHRQLQRGKWSFPAE
ncbi:MAG: response regulator [Chloroflexaceae bacterium]|nr:response regulator [Chloroflexaceae bacterium]